MLVANFYRHYPIIAGLITFPFAVLAGLLDLIVLKRRPVAWIFWLFGFFPVAMPIYGDKSLGGARWLFGALVTILYVLVISFIDRSLRAEKSEPIADDSRDD